MKKSAFCVLTSLFSILVLTAGISFGQRRSSVARIKLDTERTVGQIDQMALFYLKSRGIPNTLSRRLLTYAFAADVLETIEVTEIREGLEKMTLERFV